MCVLSVCVLRALDEGAGANGGGCQSLPFLGCGSSSHLSMTRRLLMLIKLVLILGGKPSKLSLIFSRLQIALINQDDDVR